MRDFSDTERSTFVVLNTVILVITVIANIFVLILFYQEQKTLRKTHAFVISLSIGDLFQGSIGIPLTIAICYSASLGSNECVIICAIRLSICFTSLFNTVAASLDRFWAVVHPIHYHTKVSARIISISIFCCWMFAWAIGCLCFIFAIDTPHPEKSCFEIKSRFHDGYLTFIVLVAIPLCALIMVLIYIIIYWRWNKRIKPSMDNIPLKRILKLIFFGKSSQTINTSKGQVIEKRKIREIRTTLLMFSTVFLFVTCWVPWPIVLNLIRRFRPDINYTHSAMICYTFVSLNSMINPFLYVFHIEKWRDSLKNMLNFMCGAVSEEKLTSNLNQTCQHDF